MANKLTVTRGTTYSITYQHQHDGVNEPLTGATLYFTVKSTEYDTDATDTDALIAKTVTSFTDAPAGTHVLTLDPTDTYITPGKYFYDIRVAEASGAEYKTVSGEFKVVGTPTNRNV